MKLTDFLILSAGIASIAFQVYVVVVNFDVYIAALLGWIGLFGIIAVILGAYIACKNINVSYRILRTFLKAVVIIAAICLIGLIYAATIEPLELGDLGFHLTI